MSTRDKSHKPEKRPANPSARAGQKNGPSPAELGTHSPDGPIDDQPQRDDEYLSSMLNEFNPQRKDEKAPSSDSAHDNRLKPDKSGKQGDNAGTQQDES